MLRGYPDDEASRRWQQRFIGRSGIKIRVKLSSSLQPANWLAEGGLPEFVSCLNDSEEAAQLRQAARKLRPYGTASPVRALGEEGGGGGGSLASASKRAAPPARVTRRSAAAVAAARATSPSRDALPSAVTPSGLRESLESTEGLYKTALAMEQDSLSNTEWMTATLIDALMFQLAKTYRNVAYMPCIFCAYDLPRAAKGGPAALRALRPRDMLGRELCVVPDALSPVVEVAGYTPLSTHVPRVSAGGGGSSCTVASLPQPWASQLVTSHQPGGVVYTPPSYSSANPSIVFFSNVSKIHWTVIRVDLGTRKRIEVYEPFGLESAVRGGGSGGGGGGGGGGSSSGGGGASSGEAGGGFGGGGGAAAGSSSSYATEGLSLRNLPRHLLSWLDAVCPLPTEGGWRARSKSAITWQQQGNGWDCGVACLLYAEKIGQGLEAETICNTTDQDQISVHRAMLQRFLPRFTGAQEEPAALATSKGKRAR
jgi:hypothetical protein